jgi:AcrR family transcriptional regulator
MFHVKVDKRSQASAALVVEGMYECLSVKPFDKITISDIQKSSSVGRATFYRLFDRLPDVLAYECDNVLRNFLNRPALGETDEQFTAFFSEWMQHDELLEALMTSGNSELLYAVFRNHASALGSRLSPHAELSPDEIDFFICIATAALISSLESWINHGRRETPDQLTKMMRKTLETVVGSF